MDVRPAKIAQSALPALVAMLLFLISAPAASAAVVAKPADAFVDSIGVNTHTSYDDTVYHTRFGTMKERLAELGIRHIREGLMPNRPDQYEHLNDLAGIGVKATVILGEPEIGAEGMNELIATLKESVLPAVDAVEGPNEVDMNGDAGSLPQLAEYQRQLYAAVKQDPALTSLPVIGPSLVHRRNQEALGDISGQLDYGNVHSYPGGDAPEANLDTHFASAANNSGSKPLFATETGYHTTAGWTGDHLPTSEEAMATYMPRLYLEYFRRGIARTFSYELLDQGVSGEREDNFGLLRNDLSPKPAFTALRNLIEILEDRGPAFAPTSLPYTLGGDSDDVQHLLLQKRDGSFYLALWREGEVWDPESQTPVAGHTGTVKVNFGALVPSVEAYAPNVAPTPVSSLAVTGGGVNVEVGPQVVILKVPAGGRVPQRIKLWVSRHSVPAGGRVAVRGQLPGYAKGRSLRVTIEHWRSGSWRTVGHGRSTRSGAFKKAIRLSPARFGSLPKLRVVAREAKPSRSVRLRIRGSNGSAASNYRAALARGAAVSG